MAGINVICPNCGARIETDATNKTVLCYECFNAFRLTEDIMRRSKNAAYETNKPVSKVSQSSSFPFNYPPNTGFESESSAHTGLSKPVLKNEAVKRPGEAARPEHEHNVNHTKRKTPSAGNSYFDLASSYGLEEENSSVETQTKTEAKPSYSSAPPTPGLKIAAHDSKRAITPKEISEYSHANRYNSSRSENAHAAPPQVSYKKPKSSYAENDYRGTASGYEKNTPRRTNTGKHARSGRGKHSAAKKRNPSSLILISVLIILALVVIILLVSSRSRKSDIPSENIGVTEPAYSQNTIPQNSQGAESIYPQNTNSTNSEGTELSPGETDIAQTPAQPQNVSYEGFWKRDPNDLNNTISIYYHEGQTIGIYVTCVRGNAAQIAAADIPAITIENDYGEFNYRDSFGNTGTGTITFYDDEEFSIWFGLDSNPQGWGIVSAAGEYYNTGLPAESYGIDGLPLGSSTVEARFAVWEYDFKDIICYPTYNNNITTYADIGVPFEGRSYIDGSATADEDACVVKQFFDNGWMKLTYQTYKGAKTAYCYTSDFMSLDASGAVETSSYQDEIVYKKPNLYEKLGTITSRDIVYVVSNQDSVKQIIYPLDTGGWGMGWIASSKLR